TAAEGGGVRPDPRLWTRLSRPGFSGFRAAAVPGLVADGWTGPSRTSHGVTQWRNLRGDLNDLSAGSGVDIEPRRDRVRRGLSGDYPACRRNLQQLRSHLDPGPGGA